MDKIFLQLRTAHSIISKEWLLFAVITFTYLVWENKGNIWKATFINNYIRREPVLRRTVLHMRPADKSPGPR